MPLFFADKYEPDAKKGAASKTKKKGVTVELLHKMECKLCPLREYHESLNNPDMKPSGNEDAEIYFLGEAPGREEDIDGLAFIGQSGQLLKTAIAEPIIKLPKHEMNFEDINEFCLSHYRFNNVVRTRPPKNRTPVWEEIESCRPSVIKDIEKVKPKLIITLGGVPLNWIWEDMGQSVIGWRGRYFPAKIGSHLCWVMPTLHPSYLIRTAGMSARRTTFYNRKTTIFDDLGADSYSEDFASFKRDIQGAMAKVNGLPNPKKYYVDPKSISDGIQCIDGKGEDDFKKAIKAIKKWINEKAVGVDLETWPLKPYNDESKLLSIAIGTEKEVDSIALEHKDAGWSKSQLDTIFDHLYKFFTNGRIKIAQNAPFEMEWIGFYLGWETVWESNWRCTQAEAYLLDRRRKTNNLDFLCSWRFGLPIKSMFNLNKKKMHMEPLDTILKYNGSDTKHTVKLHKAQIIDIKNEKLVKVLKEQCRRLPTIVLSQLKGIPIDQEINTELSEEFENNIEKTDRRISKLKCVKAYERDQHTKFNPGSPKQVAELIEYTDPRVAETVGVAYLPKGPKGHTSTKKRYETNEAVLGLLMEHVGKKDQLHKFAQLILDRREYTGTKAKYLDSLCVGGEFLYSDMMAHPNFNSAITNTRRTSSDRPNFQNFPKRKNKHIRSQIKPGEGYCVLSCDYGQIEARVLGMASGDKQFCKALWEDYDVHMEWAERLARAYPARVGGLENMEDPKLKKKFRDDVKNQWVFPLFYGAQAPSVSANIKIPLNIVEKEMKRFWKQFSGIAEWQEQQIKFYHENGYLYSLTGFKFLPPLDRNKLLNYSIQGSSSDIVVDGWNRLSEIARETDNWDLQAPINVHDDLTFMLANETREHSMEIIITEMLACKFEFITVPLMIEASLGDDWYNQEELGKFRSDRWTGRFNEYGKG